MKLIREFNEFDFITNEPINPWLEYDGVHFDIEPSPEDVNTYIELALNTREVNNKDAWDVGREQDIKTIIKYKKKYGNCYLVLHPIRNELSYSDSTDYYGEKTKYIKYSQLIPNDITESEEEDDWTKWIKDLPLDISFSDAQMDKMYKIEFTDVLYQAVEACDHDLDPFYRAKTALTLEKKQDEYSDVFCDHESDEVVDTIRLRVFDKDGIPEANFWVTEDMVKFYPMDETINESEENIDPWYWAKEIKGGIELQPNTLYYFKPTLTINEIEVFANNIINSEYIKNWLLTKVVPGIYDVKSGGLNYFVTSNDVNEQVFGWCTGTPIERALLIYPKATPVDARKEFLF